jgi:hypothetical protein
MWGFIMRVRLYPLLCLLLASPVFGQISNRITVVTDTVEFWMGSGFTAEEAYTKVLARAKRQAVEKAAATYIRSYSRSENLKLTEDIVEAVQLGTVLAYDILWKNEDAEETGVQRIVIQAIVECPSLEQLRAAVEGTQMQTEQLKKGELSIESFPQSARIYVNGEFTQERTPHIFRNLVEGTYDISLRLDGYATKSFSARVEKTDPQYMSYILERMKGKLRINCNVSNATVILGSDTLGNPPLVTPYLLIGQYDLSIIGPEEYEPYTAEVEVAYGTESVIRANLRKRPGQILVFTNIPDVFLKLRGTNLSGLCEDSYLFRNIEPGQYTLTASKDGFSFEDKSVVIKPNKTETIDLGGTKSEIKRGTEPSEKSGHRQKIPSLQRKRPITINGALDLNLMLGFPGLKDFNRLSDELGFGQHHLAPGAEIDFRINPGQLFGGLAYEYSGSSSVGGGIKTYIRIHSFKLGVGYMNSAIGFHPAFSAWGGWSILTCSRFDTGSGIDSHWGNGFTGEFRSGIENMTSSTIYGFSLIYKVRRIDRFDGDFITVDHSGIYIALYVGFMGKL